MKTIEKNEKILAKTVTRNNKRIKELGKDLDKLKENGVAKKSEEESVSSEFKETVQDLNEDFDSLKSSVEDNEETLKNIEDKLDEMSYVLDSLNPLKYLTSSEVADLIDEKIEKKLEEDEGSEED